MVRLYECKIVIIFFILGPNICRTVSLRRFFWVPTTYDKKIILSKGLDQISCTACFSCCPLIFSNIITFRNTIQRQKQFGSRSGPRLCRNCLQKLSVDDTSRQMYWTFWACFLSIDLNMFFGCSKEPSHWDDSFEYIGASTWDFGTHHTVGEWRLSSHAQRVDVNEDKDHNLDL